MLRVAFFDLLLSPSIMFSGLIYVVTLCSFSRLNIILNGYTTFVYSFVNRWTVLSPLMRDFET